MDKNPNSKTLGQGLNLINSQPDFLDSVYRIFTTKRFNDRMKTVFELQLPALLCFVKESCHENLHCSLNELRDLANDRDMGPIDHVASFVKDFIRRVQFHLAMEENDLFPLIEQRQCLKTNIFPIHDLLDDHDEFDKDLFILRSMTNNFEVPENFDDKKMYFYRKLIELERIVKNHIQIENHVLYPMVLKIS